MISYLEKESDFDNLVESGLTLVDFYADWCGPCKLLGAELEKLDNIKILKINCDMFNELALKNGVMSIPAIFLYKDGKIIKQSVGYKTIDELKEFIKE